MKRTLTATVLGLRLLMAHSQSVAGDGVLAPGAKVEKLAGDFQFTEGLTCDAEGSVFFTDQPNDRILKCVLIIAYQVYAHWAFWGKVPHA